MALWEVKTDGGVAVARYTNPPMNYFCRAAMAELGELIDRWRDPAVRVVILTGGPPGQFITHYSVEELVKLASRKDLVRLLGPGLGHNYHDLLRRLGELAKPVIAAMSGDTMGGGLELSLACDIRIAQAGDYRYGLPEATLGILPGGSGTQRLSRLIGAGRAVEFIMRGRICAPDEALALGLAHEVADDALARAREVGAQLAEQSPVALAEIKRAVYQGSEVHFAAGLQIESHAFMQTLLSDEALQTMQTYVDLPHDQRRAWLERHFVPPPAKGN